jgi:ribosomal protein L7/L12
MEPSFWQWIAIVAVVAVISLKLGATFGRLSRDSEDIIPISTTRISPGARAQIDDALRRGNKIEAIKLLRADTGCGLAEAKKTVEALEIPEPG